MPTLENLDNTVSTGQAPALPVDAAATAPVLNFTENAANKIKTILATMAADDNDPSALQLKLRISVTGGGCSGLKYDFAFTDQQESDDYAVTEYGTTLLVDTISLDYLEGATVDYKEDASGEQFIIRNPNASSSCGCGSSFAAG